MIKKLCIVFPVVLFFCIQSSSQAGTPDISFGVNGVAKIPVLKQDDQSIVKASHIAQQKDGKFIVTVSTSNSTLSFYQGYIYRLENDGSIDPSFGLDGRILIDSGKYPFSFYGLVLDSDDNILLSTSLEKDTYQFGFKFTRLKQDGGADSTFGNNGNIIIDSAGYQIYTFNNALALQPDGKILTTAGRLPLDEDNENVSSLQFRFKKNGTLDSSFNGKGYFIRINRNYSINSRVGSQSTGIGLQSTEKIIYGGTNIERFNSDGTRDWKFGDSGVIKGDMVVNYYGTDTSIENFSDIQVLPNNGFMCTGSLNYYDQSAENWYYSVKIYKFKENGQADSSFNSNGVLKICLTYCPGFGWIRNLTIQPDEKFLVDDYFDGGYGPSINRFLKNGKLDDSFSNDGTIHPAKPEVNDIILQNDFKIVVLESEGSKYFYVYRYNNDIILPVNFISFTATKNNQSVLLNWNTCNEINNKGFYIQRSNTINGWADIGYVSATSIDKACNDYSFTDTKPLNGNNFYRLRQVNNDGKPTLSKIVNVIFENSLISVSPNPVKNILTITRLGPNNNSVLYLVNSNGETVNRTQTLNSSFNWNIQNLSAGNYFLVVSQNDNVVASLKFIKQ